ncbi:hypothetical protein ACTXT7_015991 [Hymenolepis weldensis]
MPATIIWITNRHVGNIYNVETGKNAWIRDRMQLRPTLAIENSLMVSRRIATMRKKRSRYYLNVLRRFNGMATKAD